MKKNKPISLFATISLSVAVLIFSGCHSGSKTRFELMSEGHTGINFNNTLFPEDGLNVLNYIYFYNGGGVAVGDINNDGLPDIFFTGNMVHNRLYVNKGNFEFEDITEVSGVAANQGWCTGATMVDVNGDGKLDIYVCRSAAASMAARKNLLFINQGPQDPNKSSSPIVFSEQAEAYGLADAGYSTQAAFFDYDKDGDLDMFLINHSLKQYASGAVDNPGWRNNKLAAFECKLYRNDADPALGHARYTDVSAAAGINSNVLTFGLGLAVSDLNGDGWPDVYVSNDFNESDYLFVNNKNGTFTENLRDCMDQTSLYSMGSDAADYNNDGLPDLMTLDMLPESNHTQKMHSGSENFNKFQQLFSRGFYYQYSRNMLQTNNGDGTFSENGQMLGVSNTDWSWSALFTDLDNDGNKDLFVTNGSVKDYTDMDFLKFSADMATKGSGSKEEMINQAISGMPENKLHSYVFKNVPGASFRNMDSSWGIKLNTVSAGAAYADLDNDGDMDLVINNTNDLASVFRNNSGHEMHFLKVNLKGNPGNPSGIGAKCFVYSAGKKQLVEQMPTRGFQSSVDPVLHFGLGASKRIDSLRVVWPDNKTQLVTTPAADTLLALRQSEAKEIYVYPGAVSKPVFTSSVQSAFKHEENSYNDFDRQSLLISYLSRQGPAIVSADVNHDGIADIFMGGAKGHPSQLFTGNRSGTFTHLPSHAIDADSSGEVTAACFFDADGDGDSDLYLAHGGSEFEPNDPALQGRLLLNDGKGQFSTAGNAIPAISVSAGCVRAADFDADGDMDLFIGGRVIPGSFPVPAASYLLQNDGTGHFTDISTAAAAAFSKLGLVTDACWTDIDRDGHPELIVVGEWMPVKVFSFSNGKLNDVSAKYIHSDTEGWWNCITAADMDGDGDVDLILGNQGLNQQFQATAKEPLSLYYKDFDGNGTLDPIFTYYLEGKNYPAASMDDITAEIPMLKKKFLQYKNYADASIDQVFSPEQLKDAGLLHATVLSSVYLENKGTAGFSIKPLPAAAQNSPVHTITPGDFNHDGKPDLLLAGNNTWTRIRFGRFAANHGVLLEGDGKGGFSYVSQDVSGLKLRGDVRSAIKLDSSRIVVGVNDRNAVLLKY